MREALSSKLARRARMSISSAALWAPDKLSYRLGLRSASGLTLPNFIGLGAQKAGSTWLWENLRCHPELFLPNKKELHYFNLYFYKSVADYASYFRDGRGKVTGEITPAYGILSQRRIGFIRKIMPVAKLILILRNPIDRAWSRAKMRLRQPGDTVINLEDFSPRDIHRALVHPSSLARGNYIRIIDNWLKYFPAQQFHICFYEDLSERPRNFLQGIFEFLGVRADVDWAQFPFNVVSNPTPPTPIPREYKRILETLYDAEIDALCERFGSKVQTWRCS